MAKTNAKPKTTRKMPPAVRTKKSPVPAEARSNTKQASLIEHLQCKEGATLADLVKATGWQVHSVRGAISGTLKKKLGYAIATEVVEGRGRVYRIVAGG